MIWVAARRCRRVDLDDFTLTSWFALAWPVWRRVRP
jgi:hypothetical protein